jgi:cytochrome oxidase Cu insertion factor (SCO1/SenC/PrrC family)
LKRLKKIALSVLVAAALAFGVTVGGSTVAAQPAQAYSGSYDYYTYAWCHIYYYKWRDYCKSPMVV